jgi:tetratricopeptide (TPR) repeat protein
MGWFEALARMRENSDIRLAIVNMCLKNINGIEAIAKIKGKNSGLPVIAIVKGDDSRLVQNTKDLGVQDIIFQPVDVAVLLEKALKYAPPAATPAAPAPAPQKAEKQDQRDELDESGIKGKFYQAQSLFANGDIDGAIKIYNEVANEKRLKDSYLKYTEEAAYQEGRCWMRKKDYNRAIEVLKNFVTKAPKSFFVRQALFYMAGSYEALQDKVKAVNFYTKVISLGGMDSLATQSRKQIEKLK